LNDKRSSYLLDLSSTKLTKVYDYSYIRVYIRVNGLVKCEEEYGFSAYNYIEIGINSKALKQKNLKAFKYLANKRYTKKK